MWITLCLDKTGTITDGNLKVRAVIPLGETVRETADPMVRAYMAPVTTTTPPSRR